MTFLQLRRTKPQRRVLPAVAVIAAAVLERQGRPWVSKEYHWPEDDDPEAIAICTNTRMVTTMISRRKQWQSLQQPLMKTRANTSFMIMVTRKITAILRTDVECGPN